MWKHILASWGPADHEEIPKDVCLQTQGWLIFPLLPLQLLPLTLGSAHCLSRPSLPHRQWGDPMWGFPSISGSQSRGPQICPPAEPVPETQTPRLSAATSSLQCSRHPVWPLLPTASTGLRVCLQLHPNSSRSLSEIQSEGNLVPTHIPLIPIRKCPTLLPHLPGTPLGWLYRCQCIHMWTQVEGSADWFLCFSFQGGLEILLQPQSLLYWDDWDDWQAWALRSSDTSCFLIFQGKVRLCSPSWSGIPQEPQLASNL